MPELFTDPSFIVLLIAGACAGGFINGLAGFGTALFTLGFWLQIMPPLQAVSIIVILSAVTGFQGLWVVRGAIRQNPRRLAVFLLPGIIGIPLGISGLSFIDGGTLKLIIGGFMFGYGLFFMMRKNLPTMKTPPVFADGLVGLAGGVLGGLASLSGALPTFWLSLRDWPKSEIRAVLQPFNMTILGLTACGFWYQGVYDRTTLIITGLMLPVSILCAQFGIILFRHLTDEQFRRGLMFLMFVSGTFIIASSLSDLH